MIQSTEIRLLWWDDRNLDKPPTKFRIRVHFWYSFVPRVHELRADKKTADEFERVYGSEPADFVSQDFYVDDGIKSIAAAAQASTLIQSTKILFAKGGFNLHNFISNSKDVIGAIPREQRASGIKELDLAKGDSSDRKSVWDTLVCGFRRTPVSCRFLMTYL